MYALQCLRIFRHKLQINTDYHSVIKRYKILKYEIYRQINISINTLMKMIVIVFLIMLLVIISVLFHWYIARQNITLEKMQFFSVAIFYQCVVNISLRILRKKQYQKNAWRTHAREIRQRFYVICRYTKGICFILPFHRL